MTNILLKRIRAMSDSLGMKLTKLMLHASSKLVHMRVTVRWYFRAETANENAGITESV